MDTFAQFLSATRRRAGVSQRALAKQLDIDPSYLSRIERGEFPPPAREKVVALLNALHVTGAAERTYGFLLAGHGSMADLKEVQGAPQAPEEPKEATRAPSSAVLMFPDVDDLESQVLVERLRMFLEDAARSEDRLRLERDVIRDFLDWREYCLDGDNG